MVDVTCDDTSTDAIPEKFENPTIAGHFGFVFEENLGREIT